MGFGWLRLGVQVLEVEMDSHVVVNVIATRSSHCPHLHFVLEETLHYLDDTSWSCVVRHVCREANHCADLLAGLGNGLFQWTILDEAPSMLRLALDADVHGISSHMLVH